MAPYKVVIVDDEPASIVAITQVLETFEQIELLATFNSGITALPYITKHRPDLVFLDVEMPHMNGLELIEKLKGVHCQIVFITAKVEYALAAFNTQAIDYIVKPLKPEYIEKSLFKLQFQQQIHDQTVTDNKLCISDGATQHQIDFEQISHIDTIDRYSRINLHCSPTESENAQSIITNTSLNQFEATLPESLFIRVHRNTIINITLVEKIISNNGNHQAFIKYQSQPVEVARRRVSELKKRLSQTV